MRQTGANEPVYPIAGNNRVDNVEFKDARVYINTEQYFDGVAPDVWAYTIGGYQVAHKWLKDRKNRLLTFDELQTYVRIIAALERTLAVEKAINDIAEAAFIATSTVVSQEPTGAQESDNA